MTKWDVPQNHINFLEEETVPHLERKAHYKIVIADDEEDVHRVTKMILKNFEFEGRTVLFIDTYSGEETIAYLKENKDVAVLFLDVVMEDQDTGLKVIRELREEMKNFLTRIILRTGQPGEAPEEKIIFDYDINDYRLKTELTAKRLKTSLYAALRSYRDLTSLEKHRKGLVKIIEASARLFEQNTLNEFLTSVLQELSDFHHEANDMLFVREGTIVMSNGFVSIEQRNKHHIIAATGKFESKIGLDIEAVEELAPIALWMRENEDRKAIVHALESGFIVETQGKSNGRNFIYIEGPHESFDYDLIQLFLSNFAVAVDNYMMNNMINTTQREIIFALGETVESHFEETGSHIKRISAMMYEFALCSRFSYGESEMLKMASTMHDLGKIAISDVIIKKPGKLTDEEFEIMKTHCDHGYKILNKSDLPVLSTAAEIAHCHHEKFDGTGYPTGIKGLDIPMSARMMAIVDVFDAMTHKRVYKDALPMEETIEHIISQKGSHFDPELVDLFIRHIDTILKDVGP